MNDEATFLMIRNETEAMGLQGLLWMDLQGRELNHAGLRKEGVLQKLTEIPKHSTHYTPLHLSLISKVEEIVIVLVV